MPRLGCTEAPCSGSGVGDLRSGRHDRQRQHLRVKLSYGSGDGTVPLYSANLYDPAVGLDDRGNAHDMYWCGVSHFGLAWSTPVWQAAVSYLDGSVSYAADLIGPGGACPDGTDGSLTGSPLIGAPATPPVGQSPPDRRTDATCSASTAPTAPLATSFTIENHSAAPVDLEWYDPSCQEVLYAEIPPQMQLTQKDYVGDVWHLRSPADGSLIGTVDGGRDSTDRGCVVGIARSAAVPGMWASPLRRLSPIERRSARYQVGNEVLESA